MIRFKTKDNIFETTKKRIISNTGRENYRKIHCRVFCMILHLNHLLRLFVSFVLLNSLQLTSWKNKMSNVSLSYRHHQHQHQHEYPTSIYIDAGIDTDIDVMYGTNGFEWKLPVNWVMYYVEHASTLCEMISRSK